MYIQNPAVFLGSSDRGKRAKERKLGFFAAFSGMQRRRKGSLSGCVWHLRYGWSQQAPIIVRDILGTNSAEEGEEKKSPL